MNMHFLIENPTPGKKLGLPPGTAREVSDEEMKKIAKAVARCLSPVAQRLVNQNDAQGQGASVAIMGPSNAARIRCHVVHDDGTKQELSTKDLRELYSDDIKAQDSAKKDAHAKRLAEKRAGR